MVSAINIFLCNNDNNRCLGKCLVKKIYCPCENRLTIQKQELLWNGR